MKILFVITELYEGGAENALWQVARGLSERDHEIAVVCLYGDDGDVAVRLRNAEIAVHCLNMGKVSQCFKLLKLRSIVKEFNPDLVHSWLFHASLASRLFLPRSVNLINSFRVVEPRRGHVLLDRWTRGNVRKFICVSSDVMDFARGRLHITDDKCVIIGNGVDFAFFQDSRDSERDFSAINGLTIARITQQKGIDILIAALAQIPDTIEWQWKFVGDTPEPAYSERVQNRARELGIDNKIQWVGFVKRENIIDYYRGANLFALPSRWEGQANVVIEAMAAGVPVISSRTDGISDLATRNEASLTLVSDNTPEEWQKAIERLWNDPDTLRTQISAGIDVAKGSGWEAIVEAHLNLYQKILLQAPFSRGRKRDLQKDRIKTGKV